MTELGPGASEPRPTQLSGRGGTLPAIVAAGVLLGTLAMRSAAGADGVSLAGFFAVAAAFVAFGLLPGYLLLKAFGAGHGSWLDWLGPAFGTSLALWWVFSVPAFLLGWPLWAGIAWLAAVSLPALGAVVIRRRPGASGGGAGALFLDGAPASWNSVLLIATLLAMAVAAAKTLVPMDSTNDLWFHGAGINAFSQSGRLSMADPFHDTAAPHPMYFMNLWYVLVAAIGWASGAMTVDVVRALPVLLVPVAVSGCARVLRVFLDRGRPRLLGLGLFVVYYTFLAASMESTENACMWSEFCVPRWVALFAVYPLALAAGAAWILEGRWRGMLAAAALNGMAIFIHPQGAQYYVEVLGCVALGGIVFRSWTIARRAVLAAAVAALLVAPFFLLRHAYLPAVAGSETVPMLKGLEGARASLTQALGANFGDIYFGRAASLLGSPLFLLGLGLLPVWWIQVRRDPRRMVLLLALGPALCLPLIPFLQLLPVQVYPSILYRGVWAAPVLVATALALDGLLRPSGQGSSAGPEGAPRPGLLGWAYMLAALVAAALLHLWPPYHFEPWWKGESLAALGCLGAAALALLWRPSGGGAWRRALPFVPAGVAACCLMVQALWPHVMTDADERFAAQKESLAVKALADQPDRGGYVLSDSILSAHLTALTGAHVLGGAKTAVFVFSHEDTAMHDDLIAMLRGDGSLADFLSRLQARDVRRVCIFADRSRSLAERLDRFPTLFPIMAGDRDDSRLYRVDLSPAARQAEAARLVAAASSSEPQMAVALLEDAQAVWGGRPDALADARSKAGALAGEQEAQRQLALSLLDSNRLIRKNLDAAEAGLELFPAAASRAGAAASARGSLPREWQDSNEVCLRLTFPGPQLVESVSIEAGPTYLQRMPDLVRARLSLPGRPPVWVELKRQEPGKPSGRTVCVYRSEPILLRAESLELRLFMEHVRPLRLSGLKVSVLVASNPQDGPAVR